MNKTKKKTNKKLRNDENGLFGSLDISSSMPLKYYVCHNQIGCCCDQTGNHRWETSPVECFECNELINNNKIEFIAIIKLLVQFIHNSFYLKYFENEIL